MKNQEIGKVYEINGIVIKNHGGRYKEIFATVDKWNEILDKLYEDGGASFYEMYGTLEEAWFAMTQSDDKIKEYGVTLTATKKAWDEFMKVIG